MMSAKDVCRTCFHSGGALYPLFDSNATLPPDSPVFTFIEMLQFFTDIRISYQDGCPIQLCTDCRDDVQRIYTFILKCRRADANLKQLKDVKINLTKLRDDSNQEKGNNIVRLQNESSASVKIKEEPFSDPIEKLDAAPKQEDNLLRDDGNVHEIFVDGHLVKVKEEPELNIEVDDPGRGIDLDTMQSLFQSRVPDNQMEQEKVVSSLNSNEYERSPHRSSTELPSTSDSSGTATNVAYICSECCETFRSESKLHEHMAIHGGESEQFECVFCLKQHRNKDDLRIHMIRVHRSENNEKRYKCPICEKRYTQKSHLNRHMEDHGGHEKSLLECFICKDEFRSKRTFINHLQEMHGIRL